MPTSSHEAGLELRAMLNARGLTAKELALAIGRSEPWVSRRLNGVTRITLDDYGHLKSVIESVAPRESLFDQEALSA